MAKWVSKDLAYMVVAQFLLSSTNFSTALLVQLARVLLEHELVKSEVLCSIQHRIALSAPRDRLRPIQV